MFDKHTIHERICHLKKHGDNAEDALELAALIYVKEHMGREDHEGRHLSHEDAVKWVNAMRGDDPAVPVGGKWTMEQIKPIAQKYGVPTEGERFWEFYAVTNAMYSDYYPVAKKYNVLTPDFFADLAMAFISDKDAVENKAAMYYECIVEK